MAATDFAALERDFRAIRDFAPPGYDDWTRFAEAGELAAKNADAPSTRQACKGCHDANRARYIAELRDRPLP